jgi:transcriptional regulator with XRE-family HTH domain
MPTTYTESLSTTFGNWLKSQRRRLDWTQDHLAANAFCSVSTIRKIESGDLTPSRALAEQLAQTFAIPPQKQADFLAFARGLSADFLAGAALKESSLPFTDIPVRSAPEATIYHPPAPLTALIGREREVQSGVALLRRANVRVMTLVGPPGAGKTRLSLALGEALHLDFAQGVCFVPLAPISDPALVLSAIAQALLLREVTGTPLAQTLHEFLADKHLLLVLDNFEQVSEAAPRIAELLTAAPRVKVLASSREPLRLYGEQEFPVPPLAVPDVNHLPTPDLLEMYPAVDLFAQRAQAVRPGFAINAQNATAIAHICAWLDGLPLALEIAAAHVKWKSPAALLGQLRQQLMGLTGSQRDLTPRQQTLRGAIDWSYKLLSWAEQELLMALSVTNGGCGLAMAAELSGNDQATCDRLVRGLAEKSLLQ